MPRATVRIRSTRAFAVLIAVLGGAVVGTPTASAAVTYAVDSCDVVHRRAPKSFSVNSCTFSGATLKLQKVKHWGARKATVSGTLHTSIPDGAGGRTGYRFRFTGTFRGRAGCGINRYYQRLQVRYRVPRGSAFGAAGTTSFTEPLSSPSGCNDGA